MKNNRVGFIIVVVLLATTSVFSLKLFFQERGAQDKLDIHMFPYVVGQWQGKDLEITDKEYDILETHNLISREYVNPSGEKLYLFIIYSETNRSVFHPPEVCLMGSGVKVVDKKREEIDSAKCSFSVNRLDTEKGDYRGLALYCYKAGNFYTDNYYLQQTYFALNQLLGKHKGGATIRVSMPIREEIGVTRSPGHKVTSRLKAFMVEAVKIIDSLKIGTH